MNCQRTVKLFVADVLQIEHHDGVVSKGNVDVQFER